MRKRAEQVDETRQRIVEATVHMHGTAGPSATTVTAIAERAGVTRLTVYRHFPDDEALFDACTAHWFSQQIVPDPDGWAEVADPEERLRVGLADLYRFYREGEPMLTNVHRDVADLPERYQQAIDDDQRRSRDVLLAPFAVNGARRRRLRAVLGHAVSFWTWRSLCLDHGLSDREAVRAMVVLASSTVTGPPSPERS